MPKRTKKQLFQVLKWFSFVNVITDDSRKSVHEISQSSHNLNRLEGMTVF